MKKAVRSLATIAVFGFLACSGDAPLSAGKPGDAPAAPAADSKAGDPHAGHRMPAEPDAGDPTDIGDPHASHREPDAANLGYDLALSTEPKALTPKAKARLVFDPRSSDGARVEHLAIVHEKPLHLLLVSRDLSFFAHEHPERQTDGTYALDFTFPDPGEYVLFGDFTPEGASGQIVRIPLAVDGDPTAAKGMEVDDRTSPKSFDDLTVSLSPAEIHAGADTMLTFTIERDGKPAEGLRPYLGAMGHCVVIDETATTFLHSHPMSEPSEGKADPGNVVQFHTVFPKPGKYKAWGQFDLGGRMLVADFALEVAPAGDAAAADPHAGHRH